MRLVQDLDQAILGPGYQTISDIRLVEDLDIRTWMSNYIVQSLEIRLVKDLGIRLIQNLDIKLVRNLDIRLVEDTYIRKYRTCKSDK